MKYLPIILAAVLIAGSLVHVMNNRNNNQVPTEVEDSFNSWATKFNKKYATPEERIYRLGVFYANVQKIMSINKRGDFKAQINKFADLTPEEFRTKFTGYTFEERPKNFAKLSQSRNDNPDSVDWVKKGKVTEVKDQGYCRAGWAFSAAGAVESAYAISGNKNPIVLSEQQLIDCTWDWDNHGCNGGFMTTSFRYYMRYGFMKDSDYHYEAREENCRYDYDRTVTKLDSYEDVYSDDCHALETAVAHQPVSIAVDSNEWTYYSGGIISRNCGTELNHAVLVVGYGTEDDQDYWLVKNSWGSDWGEKGYIRIHKTTENERGLCGVCMNPSYPKFEH